MTDNRQLLAELTRVKVLFQARALAAAMGLPHSPIITANASAQETAHGNV